MPSIQPLYSRHFRSYGILKTGKLFLKNLSIMAKTKKRNKRAAQVKAGFLARPNASSESYASGKDEKLRQSKILPLVEKLASPVPNERVIAVSAVAAMCEDTHLRGLLLKEKLVKIILEQLLTDSNFEVVVESFGLLRNLCVEEGYDVSVFLFRNGIFPAILSGIEKCSQGFTAVTVETGGVEKSLLFDYSENLISLVTALASHVDAVFEFVARDCPQFPSFIRQIGLAEFLRPLRPQLANQLLEAVYTFAESPAFVSQLFSSEFSVQNLENIGIAAPLSAVYCCGIRYQLLASESVAAAAPLASAQPVALKELLEALLAAVETVDIPASVSRVGSADSSGGGGIIDARSKEEAEAQRKARDDLRAVDVALDIVAGVLQSVAVPVDPSRGEAEAEAGAEAEAEDELDIEIDTETDLGAGGAADGVSGGAAVTGASEISSELFGRVYPWLKSLLSHEEFRVKALVALNNLVWLINGSAELQTAGEPVLGELWQQCEATEIPSSEAASALTTAQFETLHAVLGIEWALLQALPVRLTAERSRAVISVCRGLISGSAVPQLEVSQEEVAEFVTRSIGTLASVCRKAEEDVALVAEVAEFLFSFLPSSAEEAAAAVPVLMVESLDSLFDVFGDKNYAYDEPLFVGRGLLAELQRRVPFVKAAVRRVDRKKDWELKERATEAYTNLVRFIAYKQRERM